MRSTFFVLLLAGIFLDVSSVRAETAGEVAGWCHYYDVAVESVDHRFVAPTDPNAFFCWGSFAAIQELSRYVDAKRHPLLGMCLPPGGSRLQLIRVFDRYVFRHPELEHLDFVNVARTAFHEAFPCRKDSVPYQ